MRNSLKLLIMSSGSYLVSASTGTLLAIRDHLPAEFGGFLMGNDVVTDFLTWRGTALSAPLLMLLAQIVFTTLVVKPVRASDLGIGGLTVLGALYTLGQLGEPILGRAFGGATSFWAMALVATNLFFSLSMFVLGATAWRTRPHGDGATNVARST